jgi:uncharacterized membrane protein YeaQ/YmgE (transglycosylase-associated protein family)
MRPVLILAIILIGLVAGWVAQLALGRNTRNRSEAFAAGIIGSFLGGLLISLVAGDGIAIRPSGFIGSILGAIIVLAIWVGVRGRSTARR